MKMAYFCFSLSKIITINVKSIKKTARVAKKVLKRTAVAKCGCGTPLNTAKQINFQLQ